MTFARGLLYIRPLAQAAVDFMPSHENGGGDVAVLFLPFH